MTEAKNPVVSVRLTPNLKEAVDKYLERDAHVTYGDLLRDALRDKLQNEAPEIYKGMLKEE